MKITIEIDTETRTATVTDSLAEIRTEYHCEAFNWQNETVNKPDRPNGFLSVFRRNEYTGRVFINMALFKR